jgi:endonuclease YncB( thermonuclease family)
MFGLFKPRGPITRRSWINLLLAVGLLALLAIYASRSGGQVTGRVNQVPSGDTLLLGATEIGLKGIVTPQAEDPAGEAARAFLSDLALGKTVTCALTGERAWDRIFATCSLDGQDLAHLALGKTVTCTLTGERAWDRIFATCTLDGQDLAQAVVQAGFARDCPRQSEGRYEAFEAKGSANIPLPDFCAPD